MINMIYFALILCFADIYQVQATSARPIDFFMSLDVNRDGILTTSQFVEGLLPYLRDAVGIMQVKDCDKETCNNFGREFLGKKRTKGKVKLTLVFDWIKKNEIVDGFKVWKEKNMNVQEKDEIGEKSELNDKNLKKDEKGILNKPQDSAGKKKAFDIVYDKKPLSNKFIDF